MIKCSIMIRLIFLLFGAIFITLATGVTYPIYWLLKKLNRKKADFLALGFVKMGFGLAVFLCGTKVTYKGLQYLPKDGEPVVFMSNHRGLFDAILTYKVVKGRTGNLSKKELKKLPIIGWWIKSLYGVLLDRNDRYQGMQCVRQCIDHINNGISILAYPEGTRGHVEGELLMFHKGTFMIATKPQVPIIPVAINGTGDIFDDHRPYIKSRRAIVEFCEPIETKGMSAQEQAVLHDRVHDIILERIQDNIKYID